MSNYNPKAIGDIGQNCVIGELSKYGIGIAFPMSDNYPFDLIAILNTSLKKIQIKTSTIHKNGTVIFSTGYSNWYTGSNHSYKNEDVDIFAFYDAINHNTYLMRIDEIIGKRSVNIRYKEPKNNNGKKFHIHEDLIISNKRIKDVFGFDPVLISSLTKQKTNIQYEKICKECNNTYTNGNKYGKFCTYKCSSLNQRKVERPSKEKLEKLILVDKISFVKIGKDYGVAGNTVKKWCKQYEINYNGIVFIEKIIPQTSENIVLVQH